MNQLNKYMEIYDMNRAVIYGYLKKCGLQDEEIYRLMQQLLVSMVKEKTLLHIDEACQRKWLFMKAHELEHVLRGKEGMAFREKED